jgi:serine/threonine protein kinase
MIKIISSRFSYDTEKVRLGGSAQVYRGIDLSSSPPREVAIKILDAAAASEPMLQTFYDREVESLLSLNQPNIVELIDAGIDEEGKYFLVLEWVESDLKTWLSKKDGVPWEDFIRALGIPIAEALAFAHQLKIIHRDVKPGNVLLTKDGVPKLADFGISKIKSDLTVSPHTTVDFMSRPYSPPERDSTFSRDVFGFGVLIVGALSGFELKDYPDIGKALNDLDVPKELTDFLNRCVNLTPEHRPKNGLIMAEELTGLMSNRASKRKTKRKIRVDIAFSVKTKFSELAECDLSKAEKEIIEDLSASSSMRQAEEPTHFGQIDGRHLYISGGEFSYRAVVVAAGVSPYIRLTGVVALRPGQADRNQNVDLDLSDFEFTLESDLNANTALETVKGLVSSLEIHEGEKAEYLVDREKGRLLDQWRSQLRARQKVEKTREKPIAYRSFSKNGNRVVFRSDSDLSLIEIGELRKIEVGESGDWQTAGEVESIGTNEIQIWFDVIPKWIPDSGKLVLDTSAASIKINREKNALENLIHKNPEVVNLNLRDVIIDPTTQNEPSNIDVSKWFNPDLDSDKKDVVRSALGSDGMFAVEGPPGTGKTTFIAELVAQEIARNPEARVLISSQTNVALDNALVRIIKNVDQRRVIRLADRSGLKVLNDAKPLLLESQVEIWRQKTQGQARKQFELWCRSVGLKPVEIEIAGAISQILLSRRQEIEFRNSASKIETELKDPKKAIRDADREKMTEDVRGLRKRAARAKSEYSDLQKIYKKSIKEMGIDIFVDDLDLIEQQSLQIIAPMKSHEGKIHLALSWIQRLESGSEFEESILDNAQVIGGTCIGIAKHKDIKTLKYDLCIVDEASKATATETLVPLVRAKRWVLVGDQKQLPPFQEDAMRNRELIEEFELDEVELKTTLFDRMLGGLPDHSRMGLRVQRRMTKAIGELVSNCFYDGKLESLGPEPFGEIPGVLTRPITWWSTSNLQGRYEDGGGQSFQSYSNHTEVRAIRDLLTRIGFVRKAGGLKELQDVLVIAPYSSQVSALRRQIDGMTTQLEGVQVEINTIDAVQGREADLVIFSTVRSNANLKVGFLDSDKRINVALSRAKKGLILIGDSVFLSSAESPFKEVIRFITENPIYGSVETLS